MCSRSGGGPKAVSRAIRRNINPVGKVLNVETDVVALVFVCRDFSKVHGSLLCLVTPAEGPSELVVASDDQSSEKTDRNRNTAGGTCLVKLGNSL